MTMIYKDPEDMEKDILIKNIGSNDVETKCEALISLGLYAEKTEDLKEVVLENIFSNNYDVASAALIAFAHLARRNRDVDLNEFMLLIKNIPLKDDLKGVIQDVIDDIIMFCDRR